ncbi:hypothetical protein PHYC_02826 [Phycisphaerales bacterium]|nr:hypothetical protein PHYC_02826 [Phycisphaerales bacterium]
MPGGRQTTPLFDLLSKGATSSPRVEPAPRPTKPVVRVELKPQSGEASPRAAPIAPASPASPSYTARGTLRLTTNALYIGIAAVSVLLIGMYILGFKIGTSKEAAKTQNELGPAFRDRPAVTEPAVRQPDTPRLTNSAAQGPTVPPAASPAKPMPQPAASGPILTSHGSLQDPRQKDLNYLALARLPRADCDAAIKFLAANGVEAFAVPLDQNDREANNPGPLGRYRLYVMPGITGEQYKADHPTKTGLQTRVAQLGQVWQKEHRGSSNFGSTGWVKYQ